MGSTKANTIMKIAHCILQLEISTGHLKWKVSDLVRKSRISRPLIYRYFGGSKKKILLSAVQFFIEDYYDFANNRPSNSFSERVGRARERLSQYPEAILLYHKWRNQKSWLSEDYINAEKKFQTRLKTFYPHLSPEQILLAHALIHGIVTAPFITSQEASLLAGQFEKSFLR